ncbi:MAG: endonuclease, partial [Bacteroidetes bacterium]|nr:endonuclease [Bacteroidota bacterium]
MKQKISLLAVLCLLCICMYAQQLTIGTYNLRYDNKGDS